MSRPLEFGALGIVAALAACTSPLLPPSAFPDASTSQMDAGPVDSGNGPVDSGSPTMVDSGPPAPVDSGLPMMEIDSGPPPMPDKYFDGGILDGPPPMPDQYNDAGFFTGDAGGTGTVFDGGTFDGGRFDGDAGIQGVPPDASGPIPDAGPEVGLPCTQDSDCSAGTAPSCIHSPGGYCTSSCSSNTDCGPFGTCVPNFLPVATTGSAPANACLHICATTADCGRPGYVCMPDALPDACGDDCAVGGVCVPACQSDSDCTGGLSCDQSTGFCQGPIGSACGDIGNCAVSNPICTAGPAGYCTTMCAADADCGTGAMCVPGYLPGFLDDGGTIGGCVATCSTGADCRDGYLCTAIPGTSGMGCSPGCTDDSQCAPGTCDRMTHLCVGGTDGGMIDAGSGCRASGTACNSVAQQGQSVTLQLIAAAPPAASGGTIMPGTYVLTSYLRYTGNGGPSGTGTKTLQSTVVVNGSGSSFTLQGITDDQTCGVTTSSASVTESGAVMTSTETCPACTGASCTSNDQYSATSTSFSAYQTDPTSGNTVVRVFTLVP